MNKFTSRGLAGLAATAVALGLAGCSPAPSPAPSSPSETGSAAPSAPVEQVTIRMWHNGTADPLKGIWDKAARDFEASHPGVTIEATGYQNEELQRTLIPTSSRSGRAARFAPRSRRVT